MSSTIIGLEEKIEVAKKEELEATLKMREKTFELTTTKGSLEEQKNENIILKGGNTELKQENTKLKEENTKLEQDLQRTKAELSRCETEQRMFQFMQQHQQQQQQPRAPICAIM